MLEKCEAGEKEKYYAEPINTLRESSRLDSMSKDKANASGNAEITAEGLVSEKGVEVAEKSSVDALNERGYGVLEDGKLKLTWYEALYLLEKGMLQVRSKTGEQVDFRMLLDLYEKESENAWSSYLLYRDLRGRGYVVREGFGANIDFRLYERGAYGKDTASYLIMSTQEGQPTPVGDLLETLQRVQTQKKELILAVMNRRGEIVYYEVNELHT
jgi:tRNA-intron endonuclease